MNNTLINRDVDSVLQPRFKNYPKQGLHADLRKKRKDPTHRYKNYYDGYLIHRTTKKGITCFWIIYVSRRRHDKAIESYFWMGGWEFRKKHRETIMSKLPRCKAFMRVSRELMVAAGYIEFPECDVYKKKNASILYMALPDRFYIDKDKNKKGFKELEVLGRMDKNKPGLLGTFMVHRIIEKKGVVRYLLRSMEFGAIPRDDQALSLRELMLYGYYVIGTSSNDHLIRMQTYWDDHQKITPKILAPRPHSNR